VANTTYTNAADSTKRLTEDRMASFSLTDDTLTAFVAVTEDTVPGIAMPEYAVANYVNRFSMGTGDRCGETFTSKTITAVICD
jgi:hypothetical protein